MSIARPEDLIITEIVGDMAVACDWRHTHLHSGDGPATHIAYLVSCACGRQGARLICNACVATSMTTEDSAECGECGEVITPWRHVISRIEPISRPR